MRTLIIISTVLLVFGCNKTPHFPKIKFKHTEIDFGEIAQRQRITHIFKFKNIGGDTLIIEKVHAP